MKRDWIQMSVIFVIAFLLGTAFGRYSMHRGRMMKSSPNVRLEKKLDKFEKHLKLSPEQREKIGVIIKDKRQKIDALKAQTEPAMAKIWKDSSEEIRKLLSPEQIERFDQMEKRWEKRWKKNHPHFKS